MAFAEQQSQTLVDSAQRLAQQAGAEFRNLQAFTARASWSMRSSDNGPSSRG
jgi:hypothetical protein